MAVKKHQVIVVIAQVFLWVAITLSLPGVFLLIVLLIDEGGLSTNDEQDPSAIWTAVFLTCLIVYFVCIPLFSLPHTLSHS